MLWLFVYLILMLSLIPMDGFFQSTVYSLIYTVFYAAIIYGNTHFLFPGLYEKGHITLYVLAVIVFLLLIGLMRAIVVNYIYNVLFAKNPQTITLKAVTTFVIGGLMIFMLSFIFRIALAYFSLKQRSEEIIAQKNAAELNLLKAQVQPHFLFNTLNNIYYEAYLEAPRTAALIERLSDMMRYFVDESSKTKVTLATEVQFLENYISLERIRIRHPIIINFSKKYDANLTLPPMLLITFLENIFKHGIDKSSNQNKIDLSLSQKSGRLIFTTINTLPEHPQKTTSRGSGIENLRKRLIFLYQEDFKLAVKQEGGSFFASLNIPIA